MRKHSIPRVPETTYSMQKYSRIWRHAHIKGNALKRASEVLACACRHVCQHLTAHILASERR
eukprot:1157605-Pelagomonas_calceolata.AAC.1